MRALRLLVVDDDPLMRTVLSRILDRDGHLVITAADGQEGFQEYRAGRFDAVLTDRSMPVMNGDRLALEIKREDVSTPVIMITSLAPQTGEERPVGVDVILTKPVRPDQVYAALERLCG